VPKQYSNGYTVGFIGAMAAVCSLVLALAALGLKERQELNKRLDKKKNILMAFGVIGEGKRLGEQPTKEEIAAFFDEKVEGYAVDPAGKSYDINPTTLDPETQEDKPKSERRYPIYRLKLEGATFYAIPVFGKGLWSTLYGYFALEGDGNTVKGITFYDHGETPGLGAEITNPKWQKQFLGKKTHREGKLVGIEVVKGTVAAKYPDPERQKWAVDGLSGATITSKGVQDLLEKDLRKYEPYFKKQAPVEEGGA